jgi:hypothetical protein
MALPDGAQQTPLQGNSRQAQVRTVGRRARPTQSRAYLRFLPASLRFSRQRPLLVRDRDCLPPPHRGRGNLSCAAIGHLRLLPFRAGRQPSQNDASPCESAVPTPWQGRSLWLPAAPAWTIHTGLFKLRSRVRAHADQVKPASTTSCATTRHGLPRSTTCRGGGGLRDRRVQLPSGSEVTWVGCPQEAGAEVAHPEQVGSLMSHEGNQGRPTCRVGNDTCH